MSRCGRLISFNVLDLSECGPHIKAHCMRRFTVRCLDSGYRQNHSRDWERGNMPRFGSEKSIYYHAQSNKNGDFDSVISGEGSFLVLMVVDPMAVLVASSTDKPARGFRATHATRRLLSVEGACLTVPHYSVGNHGSRSELAFPADFIYKMLRAPTRKDKSA